MDIVTWRANGRFIEIDGHSIFCIDHNSEAEEVICILHGYPSCSFDYHKVISRFPEHRIIVHDHLGFGLSDKPVNNQYLLADQASIATKLWQELEIADMHLVAHDYGTSVATELIARDNAGELPFTINSLCLCNGSMLIDMAKLRFIQRLLKNPITGKLVAKFAMERTFVRNMRNIWYNQELFDEQEMKELWQLLLHNEGRKTLSKITRYINQRYDNYDRWIGALKETKLPSLILWAENDPVAVIDMARVLDEYIKNAQIHTLPETGHYPMLERPEEWSRALLEFVKKNDRPR